MKTLKQLQEEYDKEVFEFARIKEEHNKKIKEIRSAVIAHAKYKQGEKVIYRDAYSGKNGVVFGFIRSVEAISGYRQPIKPCYKVAKMTKSGKPHGTQNITYCEIDEDKLMPFSEGDDE